MKSRRFWNLVFMVPKLIGGNVDSAIPESFESDRTPGAKKWPPLRQKRRVRNNTDNKAAADSVGLFTGLLEIACQRMKP
jgi:hypothetical protein